jgi:hypothetical protein
MHLFLSSSEALPRYVYKGRCRGNLLQHIMLGV